MPHQTPFFVSTRGDTRHETFASLKIQGLCPEDGGLYVPSHLPQLSRSVLESWRGLSFPDLAQAVLSLYFQEPVISKAELRNLIERSFSEFDDAQITPVVVLDEGKKMHLLELYHGPTLSFKDVALQFLGGFLEYLIGKYPANKPVVVLGATSGDTGSAAIAGLKGKNGIRVVILYPEGKVSSVQELQMTVGNPSNVTCLACPGSFDDCQDLVKRAFSDTDIQSHVQLLGVNSINIVRILVQTVYYFYSYFRIAKEIGDLVDYTVPTGNFGDILAAYYAKRMGLPLGRLILASNSNDILPRFLKTGVYSLEAVVPTITPSMDIQISSNFERYLFELTERNSDRIGEWMQCLQMTGGFRVSKEELEQAKHDFVGYSVSEEECLKTIADIAESTRGNLVIDPHTAIGVAAAKMYIEKSVNSDGTSMIGFDTRDYSIPMVCLATAHPAKFPDTVSKALDSVGIMNSKWLTHPSLEALADQEKLVSKLAKFTIEALVKYL